MGRRRLRGGGAPDAPPAPGRLRPILLAVVVAVASALVAGAFVSAPHTGGDNAAYLSLGYSLAHDGSYTEVFDPAGAPHTKYPPVFPAILALVMLAGFRTWAAFKMVAVLSTVASAALAFLWAERRVGAAWAAALAVLFAASSAVVYYSHWILSDPTFVAFTLLALWGLERGGEEGAARGWLVLGVASAGLAYFTRSAGLPLVVALGGWLALRGRWKALAASAVALGIPMVLWLLRARGAGEGEYVSEFWLVNPYDPSLGRVGVAGLAGRVVENLVGYVGTHLPAGIVGAGGGGGRAALGILLAALALAGWIGAVRRRVGPAELLLPLYAGLILLWPAVWSGDRFALPLYPLLFLYAASAVRDAGARWGGALTALGAPVLFLAVLLPSLGAWVGSAQQASACGDAVRRGGPFACYGPGVAGFVEAAAWAGANLPDGSAVLTRKPRIFYVMSGVPSRTFPFSESPDDHLALADGVGARYELFDRWDGLATRYVAGAVAARPEAFCSVRAFGEGGGTLLLGILGPGEEGGVAPPSGEIRIAPCPPGYARAGGGEAYSSSSARIPLLDGLDP